MKTAKEIASIIKPLSQAGTLLPRSADDIFRNFEDWIITSDKSGEITGFAEFRHPVTDTAEIGSMVSLTPGTGQLLLHAFETRRRTLGILYGCAVTKDLKTARHFFKAKTQGVITDFPHWFEREKDDRYFVSWQ